MQKKALFISRKFPPAVGGMETYCLELTQALANSIDLDVIALPGRDDGSPPHGLALIWFGVKTAWSLLRIAPRYDVIHGADMAIWPLLWVAKLRAPKAKLLLSAHGSDVALAFRTGFIASLYRLYMKVGARLLSSSTILANSRATADLSKGLGFSMPLIIPLAAPQSRVVEPREPESYVLFVGRLTEQKGCGWFIEHVLPLLPEAITLHVAGTIIDVTEKHALKKPRVYYHGAVYGEELAALRRNAIAVIVPNLDLGRNSFEGFGLTATEAAAAGGVAVASDVFGLKDALIDGETGFLIAAGDIVAWTEKLREIANWPMEKRATFIANSQRQTKDYYTWARVADDTAKAYNYDEGMQLSS